MVLDIKRASKVMCVLREYANCCPGTTTISNIESKVRAKIIEVGERAGIIKRLPNIGKYQNETEWRSKTIGANLREGF